MTDLRSQSQKFLPVNSSSIQFLPYYHEAKMKEEMLTLISDDLDVLLRLPLEHFWSQLTMNKSLHILLESFLRFFPRPGLLLLVSSSSQRDQPHSDFKISIADDMEKILETDVSRKVFLVFWRCIFDKGIEFVDKNRGSLIYEYWLFDIVKIFDCKTRCFFFPLPPPSSFSCTNT